MSTSKKTAASIRQGGPGASHENAKAPLEVKKPAADSDRRRKSTVSGGGGERDSHHSHEPEAKGDGTRPARRRRQNKGKKMPGKETHEQLLRTLERRTDPDARQSRAEIAEEQHHRRSAHRNVKLSELPISRGGMNKENRDHNKHNDPGQSGHQPQDPSPDQEKH